MSTHPLEEILHPRSIAVVGASASGRGGGFVHPLIELGYKGKIYPVNPKYPEIMGLKAYGRVTDIPGPVDYVISSVPSTAALGLMQDCVEKGVKCVHFFTARFSETGRKDAADLEQEILRTAQEGGVRIIGPNCMGVYYPEEGIAFNSGMPRESGSVGLASQSGGALMDIVGFSTQKGLRFSKAISYGNALDFNECDYLEYLTQDPKTKLIMMYIEGLRDGRRFVSTLKKATAVKPVIVLKGGRGDAGTRATASHTGSMAGSREMWQSMVDQTGIVTALDFEELADIAVAFHFLPPDIGRKVGVIGGSGGTSVLAADICEEAGLNVIPLPQDIRDDLREQGNPTWDWISNPVDFSISMGKGGNAFAIAELMGKHPEFELLISFMHGPWRRSKEPFDVEKHMEHGVHNVTDKPLVVVFGNRPRGKGKEADDIASMSAQVQQALVEAGLPTYPNITRAANAIDKVIAFYEKQRAIK
jgi:acyl-CoA synthetase (NDP forming)